MPSTQPRTHARRVDRIAASVIAAHENTLSSAIALAILFPPEIISHAVWLYHRFCVSFRDIEDLLAERGIVVSYETIGRWCQKFGPEYARGLKRRQGRLGDTWHLSDATCCGQPTTEYCGEELR